MSWDVLILKFDGSPPSLDELPDDFKPTELGMADQVRVLISHCLPTVDWSDLSWGMFDGGNFTIEFNLSSKDSVDSFMLHVRGNGDAVPTVVNICRPNGWSAYDVSTGKFIDLEHPSSEGWEAFKKFRDGAIKK